MKPVLRITGRGEFSIIVDGLTSGQEAAVRDAITASKSGASLGLAPLFSSSQSVSKLVLSGTGERIKQLSRMISASSGFPAELSKKIDSLLDNYVRSDYKINCRGMMLELGSRTRIMGILN